MKKKWLCGLLAVSMIAGNGQALLANASEATYARDENGYPDLGGETITIWIPLTSENARATNDLGEYKAIQEIEEKFNVNLEFIHPPVGQEKDNFAIMMADSTLPDMIFGSGIDSYYPGGVEMAYEDGVLFDYTDYINEENTPNFYNLIKDDEFLMKVVKDDEERIIRLGAKIYGSEKADLNYIGPMIRKDYLEATGLEVPKTIDGWTEMFKAMKENGIEYPLVLDKGYSDLGFIYDSNTFSSAYGVSASGFYLKDDGTVAYGPAEDSYKDYLAQLNSWYEAGYINPDFATQSSDDAMSILAAGKGGSIIEHLYTYGDHYYVTTEKDNEAAAMVAAPIPVLNDGDELAGLRSSGRGLGDYKYITADCKNPEACIALLDALYLEDIDTLMNYGVEGIGYTVEDGVIHQTIIDSDTPKEEILGVRPHQWATTDDTDLDYILKYKYNRGCQPDALVLWAEQKTDNTLSNFILFNTEEAEVRSSYSADIETYVKEMFLKFVMGRESLDNFESYQENLKNMNLDKLIEAEQSAVDRYNNR